MSKKPLEQVTFFIVRSLGGKLVAEALRNAGANVEIHDKHFPPNTTDVDWLSDTGKRGWVILSKDERIRRNPPELAALKQVNARAFFLTQQGLTGDEMARIFAAAAAGMANRAVSQPAPFIYTLTRHGVFSRIKL